MKNGATVAVLLAGLVLGFAGGVLWKSKQSNGTAPDMAQSPERRVLTALDQSDKPATDPAGDPEGVSLDADELGRRFANLPLNEMLELAVTPVGQFELHAYFSTLNTDELAELGDRVMDGSDLHNPGFFNLTRSLYGVWARTNPQDAIRQTIGTDNKHRRIQQFRIVFEQVLASDPVYAKVVLASLQEPALRTFAMEKVWAHEAANDPQTLFDQIDAGEYKMDNYRYGYLMKLWARNDPEAAVARASGMRPGSLREKAMAGVMEILARKQPEEAVAWLDQIASPKDLKRLASTMAVGMAHSTPEIAAQWLTQQTDPSLRSNALHNLVYNWSNSDPEGAMEFAQSLEGMERQSALDRVLPEYAKEHPERAAEIFDTGIEGRDPDAMNDIARSWAKKDPTAAAAWVDALPADDNKARVQRNFLEEWSDRDPHAASAWVAAQPVDAEGRDSLVGILTLNLTRADPEAALRWSVEIEHPLQGPSLILGAAREWVAQDRAAAEAALESGELPAAAREMLAQEFAVESE